jgi:hypothetical protein
VFSVGKEYVRKWKNLKLCSLQAIEVPVANEAFAGINIMVGRDVARTACMFV